MISHDGRTYFSHHELYLWLLLSTSYTLTSIYSSRSSAAALAGLLVRIGTTSCGRSM